MTDLCGHFRAMARNNRWANRRLLGACAQLAGEAFRAPRSGFFPSVAETVGHIYEVDLYYLDALENGGRGRSVFRQVPEFAAATDLADAQDRLDKRLIAYCDALTPDDLMRTVATDRGLDAPVAERIDRLMAHLFQHQIHHRGQAHAMLSGTDVAPPQLDEFFLDFERHPDAAAIGMG